MKTLTIIAAIIVSAIWWCLVWPFIWRYLKEFLAWAWLWIQISLIRLYHLIRYRERLSTYYKRQDQKAIDDTYEPMGFPRGTFTQWQLSDGKQGIAEFFGELHGFNKVEGGNGPQSIKRMVVCRMKCITGTYHGPSLGWSVEGATDLDYTNAPVTHWREIQ
jgi:hypothetical protein